jgi:hypothetical protein
MAAYYKVDVVLNSQAVQVGLPSPQSVRVTLPLVGPQGPQGPAGPKGDPGEVSGSIGWDNVTDKPSTFAPSSHTHTASQITDFTAAVEAVSPPADWNTLANKPSTFAPSAHTHAISDVTNLQTALDGKAASSHTHTASQVTDFNTAAAAAAPVASVAGRTGAVTLAVADVANAVATSDARLSDARTPSSTLAHASTHHTGGTDALAPSDIGAAWALETRSHSFFSTSTYTLAQGRNVQLDVSLSASDVTGTIVLPRLTTDSAQNGDDLFVRITNVPTNQTLVIQRYIWTGSSYSGSTETAVTATAQGAWRFRLLSGAWTLQPVANHTHVVADVTGAAASGSITSSGLTQSTARILGRTTASTGAVEEIQIGSGLSLSAGELSATGGGGEVRSDFVSPYTYTGLANAGTSESTASWTIRRSEFDAGGSFVATLTASAVEWDDRLTASYA